MVIAMSEEPRQSIQITCSDCGRRGKGKGFGSRFPSAPLLGPQQFASRYGPVQPSGLETTESVRQSNIEETISKGIAQAGSPVWQVYPSMISPIGLYPRLTMGIN